MEAPLRPARVAGGADEGKPISDPRSRLSGRAGDAHLCNGRAGDRTVAKVITGDVTGVVVSLGGKTKDVGKTMLTDGTLNVINAMKSANVQRVAVVTSIGAGDSADQAPLVFRILMSTVMRLLSLSLSTRSSCSLSPDLSGA